MEVESGIDPAATKRWAAAQELADGVRDERYTPRRTKLWVLVLLFLIVVGGAGFVLGITLHRGPREEVPELRAWGALVILCCAFVWMVFVFIHAFRTKTFIPRWKAILSPLTRQERRRVIKQWRGLVPVASQDLPLVRAAAVQTRTQLDFQLRLLIFWAFLLPGQMLNSSSEILQVLFGIAAVLFVLGGGLFLRDRRRITRFLALSQTNGASTETTRPN